MLNTKNSILGVSFRGASLAGQSFQNASAGLKFNQKTLAAALSGIGVILSGIMPVMSGCILEFNALASESPLPVQIGFLIYVICLIAVIKRGFQLVSISFTLGMLVLTAISIFILSVNSVTPIVITVLSIILSYISIIICSFLLILHTAIVGKRASLIALTGLIAFAGVAIPFAIEGPVKKLPGGRYCYSFGKLSHNFSDCLYRPSILKRSI